MKLLTKLEDILSLADFYLLKSAILLANIENIKGYSKKQLLSVILAMQTEKMINLKALVQKLKTEPMFRRNCGLDYLDNTPGEASLKRFITQLSDTDILERPYRGMIHKAKTLGVIDRVNAAIVASIITAYEHLVQEIYL